MLFVPRHRWMPPGWYLPARIGRTSHCWLHHGAAGTSTLATLLSYHRYHRSLGWAMLGYSWAVLGDGTIYEARGWNRAGGHTLTWNLRSHAIVLVGDFSRRNVPQPMIDACATIVLDGIEKGALSSNVRIDGHRNASGNNTSCPGNGGMRALPSIRRQVAAGGRERTWFEMASRRDLENALRNVLRSDAGEAVWGHTIGHGANRRASTLLSRFQGGGIDDVLSAVDAVPHRVAGALDVVPPDPSGWVWVADGDLDEGLARMGAISSGGDFVRWGGRSVSGDKVVVVGRLGRVGADTVAPTAEKVVILQGSTREETAKQVFSFLQG